MYNYSITNTRAHKNMTRWFNFRRNTPDNRHIHTKHVPHYRRAFCKDYINCVIWHFVCSCTFNTHAYLTKRHPTQVCAVHSWRKYVLFCLDLENGSFSMIIFGTPSNHWVDLYVIFFDSSVMRCFFYWDGNGPCCWWCDASLGPKQPSGKRKSELVLTLKGSPTESTI